MGQAETKDYNLNGNNSDLFGGDTVERIHSVSIKENKEKELMVVRKLLCNFAAFLAQSVYILIRSIDL